MYLQKDLSIDFITHLLISKKKRKYYDSILVIIDRPTKTIYYYLVKIIINVPEFSLVIIYVVLQYHGFFNSITFY